MSYIIMHVDDMLIAAPTAKEADDIVSQLASAFKLSRDPTVSYYLGIEIAQNEETGELKLSQEKYTRDLLRRFQMEGAKPKATPLSHSAVLEPASSEDKLLPKGNRYAELVGALMYLAVATRPDIMQAVGALARYMATPTETHWNMATGVLKYLAGTIDYGLVYTRGGNGVMGWCDADYAGDLSGRRSTTGYVFTYNGTAISWASKLQATVACSTVEAEYMAASFAAKEGLWLRNLLADMGIGRKAMQMWGDNQGALACIKNAISSVRTKHIDVHHHFVRQRVENGEIAYEYCPTEKMIADAFTKALPVRGDSPGWLPCCTGSRLG